MAITDYQMSEIKRKAGLGEKMLTPDAEKMKVYNQYAKINNPYAVKPQPQVNKPQPVQNNFNTQPKPTMTQPAYQPYAPKPTNNVYPNANPSMQKSSGFIPTYNPNAAIDQKYLDSAGKQYAFSTGTNGYSQAGGHMNDAQLREMAYYLQEKDKSTSGFYDGIQQQFKKAGIIKDDWVKENFGEAYKKSYAIEDFLQHKFNLNGTGNQYAFGLDRDSLGFNDSGANKSQDFHKYQENLQHQGRDAQSAYNLTKQKFDKNDGKINPYSSLSGGEFFNREDNNPSRKFAYEQYIDKSALKGGNMAQYDALDYTDYDYNWATELAKDRNDVVYGKTKADPEAIKRAMGGPQYLNEMMKAKQGGEPMASISSMNAPMSANSGIPDYQMSEIIRKAQAGIPMDKPTPEKMAVYNSYRNNQPSTQGNQANSNLDSIYDPQKQAQISRFNAERDRALGLINQQKTEAKSQYVGARNQTDVVNAQNVNRLREMMAANGISGSGENVTANVALGSARQGALSGLNMQEQQQNNDFNRQIAEASSQEKLNAVLAEIEAQKAQAIMEEMWRNKEFEYGAGRDRIADTRYADETQYGRGQDSKQWEHQAGREAVEDGRYEKETGYNHGRDAIADKRYLDELMYARNQAAQSSRGRGSGGRGSGGSSSGGGSYSSASKLPAKPTKPRIMTEQQYIDAYEQSNARHKGTARVIPGSTDYINKMKKVMSDLYK